MLTLLSYRQMTLKSNMASVITGTDDMKAQCTLWIHESKSAVVVRRKFISKHPHCRNNIPSRKVIRSWYSRFTGSGRLDTENVHRGRPLIVEAISNIYQENPSTSIRQIAQPGPYIHEISTQDYEKEDQTLFL